MRNIAEASNQNPSRNVVLNMFMGWPNSLSHLSSQCYRYFCKLENKNLHMHNLTAMLASKSNSPSLFENAIRQIASPVFIPIFDRKMSHYKLTQWASFSASQLG